MKNKRIIIHCSATPNGKPFTIGQLDEMHKQRGFKRTAAAIAKFNPEYKHIGYNFVIEIDGSVQNGRGISETGAHTKGFNTGSIGICMVGTDRFSSAQWVALEKLLNVFSYMFETEGLDVKGHRDYSPDLNGDGKITSNEFIKICPGFEVSRFMANNMKPFLAHVL